MRRSTSPEVRDPAAGDRPADAPPSARVLVIDGSTDGSAAITWLLRERGYDVTHLTEHHRLVEVMEEVHPDLLLVDREHLGPEGEDVLARLKRDERWRDVPIIVAMRVETDAHGAPSVVVPAAADDYVTKPVRVLELLARVQAQLRARRELRSTRAALDEARAQLERARLDAASNRQIVDILHEVTGELSATEIYRILARRVARALDVSHCAVVLANAGEAVGTIAASFHEPSVPNLEVRLNRYPEIVAALEGQQPVLVRNAQSDPLFRGIRQTWVEEGFQPAIRSVLTLPFAIDRWRSGVLFLRTHPDERELTMEDVAFAEMVVKAAVAAIKRAQALETTRADNRRLEALATTDQLTRLLNRRALLDQLTREIDRARRYETPVTLLLLDLDHFKAINDSAGHLVGDSVLRQIGVLIESSVRTVDIAARYGGEEFVVILPQTSQDGGVIFAERLREIIERHRFEAGGEEPLHLTASIGVATFPAPRVDSTEDLFARADEALYRAKSSGRNQVRT
ncbi:MAG TPA: diguanylate cyclase [Gemmatimonadaceae bacterium]|nr:diguanylate cyclase [Gemmatimonadaceae bacterium]